MIAGYKYLGEVVVVFAITFPVLRWCFRFVFDSVHEPPPGPPLDLSRYKIEKKPRAPLQPEPGPRNNEAGGDRTGKK